MLLSIAAQFSHAGSPFEKWNKSSVNAFRSAPPTGFVLGLVDGDGGAGQGQAAGVLQGDVDAVGAGLHERPPQTHLARFRRRHVVAHDVSHLGAAGVGHDGAGRGGHARGQIQAGFYFFLLNMLRRTM